MPGWLAKMLIRKKCGGGGNPLGIVLIIIGAIMVAVCIPPWFWVALVGVAAVAIGAWLFFRPKC
nr:hypothetical protein [bacterium]